MSTPRPRSGPPRFDKTKRLLHRMYEPVYMKWNLGASGRPTRYVRRWRRFLDAISWFGDFRHGGETVVAVAAHESADGVTFWVCGAYERSAQHVDAVLTDIFGLQGTIDKEKVLACKQRIISSSTTLSCDKVRGYKKSLLHFLKRAEREAKQRDGRAVHPIFDQIRVRFFDKALNEQELCASARRFNVSGLQRLLRSSQDEYGALSRLYHYIARLSTWHRQADILVKFATDYVFYDEYRIHFLPLPDKIHRPGADAKTNLRSALGRMLPAGQGARADELHEQTQSLRTFDFDSSFIQFYTDTSLPMAVHAEVFLLEHFYFNKWTYYRNDKYIGCSKASCYLCGLYQRYHPGNPVLRPTHGNVWPRWCPPLTARLEDLEDATKEAHNLQLINQVNSFVRRDVIDEIERRLSRQPKVPDSSTGRMEGSISTYSADE